MPDLSGKNPNFTEANEATKVAKDGAGKRLLEQEETESTERAGQFPGF